MRPGALPPPLPGRARAEDENHGFRDAQSGVAPPVATSPHPYGVLRYRAWFIRALHVFGVPNVTLFASGHSRRPGMVLSFGAAGLFAGLLDLLGALERGLLDPREEAGLVLGVLGGGEQVVLVDVLADVLVLEDAQG